jgi:hypothetical protein
VKDEIFYRVLNMSGEIDYRIHILTEGPHTFTESIAPKEDLDPAPTKPAAETPTPIKDDKPEQPEQPTMTKAEMVSKLTTFQTGGVAIDKVMESMGYTKLSQVPANQYDKLLDLCQKALDGEG